MGGFTNSCRSREPRAANEKAQGSVIRFLGEWYTTPDKKQHERIKTAERMQVRGTRKIPDAPRDVFLQSGPRGILVNWRGPQVGDDVAGWRLYKDDENSLFAEIHEPATTQHFIEASAGATPPVTNIFVSSINKLGVESVIRVQAQGAATAEAAAPTMPSTPPTYSTPYTFKGGRLGFQGL